MRLFTCGLLLTSLAMAQDAAVAPPDKSYTVDQGTRIPLSLINSVSTKHSAEGDRVYLETVFPILAGGKIVIPPGSFVSGTITEVKRPGRMKGRGELFLRFDTLTLSNGVTRDFRARLGSVDGRSGEELNRKEGKIISEGNKGNDVRTIAETTAAGASIGVIAGAAAQNVGLGAGIGSAAGAAAGLAGVLLTRGPDAVLAKGSTIEMVLDRPLNFNETEINTAGQPSGARFSNGGPDPASPSNQKQNRLGRRFPY